jgi:hypothetical protein
LDEIRGTLAATDAPDQAAFAATTSGGSSSIGDVSTGGSHAPYAPVSGGSSFAIQYGVRHVKAYPITESELSELGTLGGFSTLFFSLASALVGFGGNMFLDLYLSSPPPNISPGWKIGMIAVFLIAALFAILGGFLIWKRYTKIGGIKLRTAFS